MVDVWYRERQVEEIADKLRIPKADVDLILRNYVKYLQDRIDQGKTVKVLNICYLRGNNDEEQLETLAYIATEIAKTTAMGNVTVLRVLSSLEDTIVKDMQTGIGFSIRGLVRIRMIDEHGTNRVRVKKSTKYNGAPITVVTLNAFRRRVANQNAG